MEQKAEGQKSPQHANQSRANTRNGSRLRNQEPGPAIQKSPQRSISVPHVHVLSSGERTNRPQLRVGERSEKREQSSNDPGQINQSSRAHGLHHLSRDQKDTAPNDGPRHNGSSVPDIEPADEFRSMLRAPGASCCFPLLCSQRHVYTRSWANLGTNFDGRSTCDRPPNLIDLLIRDRKATVGPILQAMGCAHESISIWQAV